MPTIQSPHQPPQRARFCILGAVPAVSDTQGIGAIDTGRLA
ncbi:hypothetical protein [Tychonema sp. LEGE 07203]|nr:hypothetical protein [Tychonema sp. LEGE 07203]